jgi:hypothetical protein
MLTRIPLVIQIGHRDFGLCVIFMFENIERAAGAVLWFSTPEE